MNNDHNYYNELSTDQYFEKALTNFTRNFAYGDAIRHLVDKGYTTEKIIREFQYPLPKDTIERIVNDRLIDLVSDYFERHMNEHAFFRKIQDNDVEFWFRTVEPKLESYLLLAKRKQNLCSQNKKKLTALVFTILKTTEREELFMKTRSYLTAKDVSKFLS